MPVSQPLDHVRVTTDFESGKTYAPVVAVKSDTQEENSGGCNIGAWSIMIFLAGMCFAKK